MNSTYKIYCTVNTLELTRMLKFICSPHIQWNNEHKKINRSTYTETTQIQRCMHNKKNTKPGKMLTNWFVQNPVFEFHFKIPIKKRKKRVDTVLYCWVARSSSCCPEWQYILNKCCASDLKPHKALWWSPLVPMPQLGRGTSINFYLLHPWLTNVNVRSQGQLLLLSPICYL